MYGVYLHVVWVGKGISCLNFKVITLDYEPNLTSRKNRKYYLNSVECFCVHTLNTLWHTHKISKNLEQTKCVKYSLKIGIVAASQVNSKKVRNTNISTNCWLVRVSLFIELGALQFLGKGGGETLALL